MTHPSGEGARSVQAVRVWSVPKEGTDLVRFLGPYRGMFVHYFKKEPKHCRGKNGCPPDRHRLATTWKGYAAGEVYEQHLHVWVPCVVEITEGLEELLHGRKLRGEVWGLTRESRPKGRTAVTGSYLEDSDASSLRPCFPIEAVLQRLYHESDLLLDLPNPMPPRLVLAPSVGVLPAALVEVIADLPPAQQLMTPAKRQELLAAMQRQMGRAASSNGKAHESNGQKGGQS